MEGVSLTGSDDIVFLLELHAHGWSSCRLFVDGEAYEICISHAVSEPYVDFMCALSAVMRGGKEASFYWYDEPGGERIEIFRKKNEKQHLKIVVAGFSESFGEEVSNFETIVEFDVNKRALLIVSYLQLKKIELLLADKTYAEHRNGNFPFREFKVFEAELKEYLAW